MLAERVGADRLQDPTPVLARDDGAHHGRLLAVVDDPRDGVLGVAAGGAVLAAVTVFQKLRGKA